MGTLDAERISPYPRVQDVDVDAFNFNGFEWQAIQTELTESVLIVRLNRPEAMNAFTVSMLHDLVFAFELADLSCHVKAVILTGTGPRAFCAGADLSAGGFTSGPDFQPHLHRDGGGQCALAIFRCRKLVIAAIQGSAVGIGITMTLPADIRIVSDTAKIAFPFVKRGIVPEATSSYFLPRLIGHVKALELCLTGDVLPSTHGSLQPLWRSVVPGPQVLPEAISLAQRLVRENSVVSMALTKNLFWRGLASPEETHLIDSQAIAWISSSTVGDAREGVESFMQKRKPQFKGTVKDLDGFPPYPWWKEVDVHGKTVQRAPRRLKL